MNRNLISSTILFTLFIVPFFAKAQYLVGNEFLGSTPATVLTAIASEFPIHYDVDYYRLTYNTVNTAGEPTIASGGVAIPVSTTCQTFPMMAYCHGTVLRQLDVPSQQNYESVIVKVFASTGFIAVAPDYLGLGENEGIHPYVHAVSEATATIDLIRATREFLESFPIIDNGETFITGYSQGGQAAMATLKYAQENGLNDELGIVAGAPCSGPYDLSGSQAEVLLSDAPYSNPGYVVYLLISYQLAYGNLYSELSDIIQSPYDVEIAPYFDGAQNIYDMGVVNAILPHQLSDLLVDTVYANFQSNLNHPLWEALRDNDTYNWTPEVPIRMFYCTGDEQVDYHNSLKADSTMNANGEVDVQAINSLEGANHGACVIPALTDAFTFFSGLASGCDFETSIADLEVLQLEIFPNPAQDYIRINIPEKRGEISIYDLYGRLIMTAKVSQGQAQVDVEKLASASYIVSFEGDDVIRRATIVVKRN